MINRVNSSSGFEKSQSTTRADAEYPEGVGLVFYTIDTNEHIINSLKRYEKLMPNRYHAECGDTMSIIDNIDKPIGFAYLDSFDYIPPDSEEADWMINMINNYRRSGITLTNENSARIHLEQTKLISSKSAEKCVIMFDDTWRISTGTTFSPSICKEQPWRISALENEGISITKESTDWYGKGATSVPWLISQGWSLIPHIPSDNRPRDDWTALKNW